MSNSIVGIVHSGQSTVNYKTTPDHALEWYQPLAWAHLSAGGVGSDAAGLFLEPMATVHATNGTQQMDGSGHMVASVRPVDL